MFAQMAGHAVDAAVVTDEIRICLGVCALLCFPPCQDTNTRCSIALLPRSVQAHPYDWALCISVTIASRARPYTFTLRKNVVLSRHLMLWTNNCLPVLLFFKFVYWHCGCLRRKSAEQKTLGHGVCPKRDGIPAGRDHVFPCFLGVSLSQFWDKPCPLQCNFPVHF